MAERWQPDRSRGVFETLLVVNGEPVELGAHLARLARSLEAVYSQEPPPSRRQIAPPPLEIALGRLRFTLAPGEDGLRLDLLPVGSSWRPSSRRAVRLCARSTAPAATAPTSGSTARGWTTPMPAPGR